MVIKEINLQSKWNWLITFKWKLNKDWFFSNSQIAAIEILNRKVNGTVLLADRMLYIQILVSTIDNFKFSYTFLIEPHSW